MSGGTGDDPYAVLPTERANPRSAALDTLPAEDLVALVFDEDRAAQAACARAAGDVAAVVRSAVEALSRGGRVVYVGAGTSGRLAVLDAVELGPTFSLEPGRFEAVLCGGPDAMFRSSESAEDEAANGALEMGRLAVGPADLVIGITASGTTAFTWAALEAARSRGAATAVVVCAPIPAERTADVVVHLDTGPEVLSGSTRMKAGTATKLALNAISLGAMARLGKVHGNRMVDVRPTSSKLRARATRLVSELGGVDAGAAAGLLTRAGDVKGAVLLARGARDVAHARHLLQRADGHLRAALAGLRDGERPEPESGA